jgi:hypothetical protein
MVLVRLSMGCGHSGYIQGLRVLCDPVWFPQGKMLVSAGWCWLVLLVSAAGWCWLVLVSAGWCWLVLLVGAG